MASRMCSRFETTILDSIIRVHKQGVYNATTVSCKASNEDCHRRYQSSIAGKRWLECSTALGGMLQLKSFVSSIATPGSELAQRDGRVRGRSD